MPGGKRIISACQQCKKSKRRCDGGEPSCDYCLKSGKHCIFTERRWRGPGKSKEASKLLIREHDRRKSSSRPDSAFFVESDESRGHRGVHDDTTQDPREDQPASAQNSRDHTNQKSRNASETTKTLPAAAERFTAFSEDIRTTTREMQKQVQANQSCLDKRVLTRLPPEHHTMELMGPVIEEIQLQGVFLTKENALNQFTEHYRAGVDGSCSNPCRWATLCSFMGMSALHRSTNGSVAALSSIAWAFFQNAFAVYAELTIQRPEVSTCEAILAMALFMLRTANACVAARLTATAAQSILMLGLHRHEHYVGLESNVAERQRSIFWVTYIVNADVAHMYGLSSPFGAKHIDVEFPGNAHQPVSSHEDHMGDLLQSQRAKYLRQRAALAVTQLRVHTLFQRILPWNPKRKHPNMHEAVAAINEELESWKRSLPKEIQPASQIRGAPLLEMPVAMLHYVYFSCVCKISMAVVLSATSMASSPVPVEQPAINSDESCSDERLARTRCAKAAREILHVLFRLPPLPFTHLWQTLCYPLSAVLILLSEVLRHPGSVQAETDAQLIHSFARYLERLRKQGSDVREILDGCNRFYDIATCALEVSRIGEQTFTFERTVEVGESSFSGRSSGDRLTILKMQSLQSRFVQVTDWLQLAQGLLSNMPAPHSKARETFCDILHTASTDETYGAFVPECLKSSTYNL